MAKEHLKVGSKVKIDIKKVIKYDNTPQYLGLVRSAIKNSENGHVYVSGLMSGGVMVRGWKFDLLGDVFIPHEAIKNKSCGKYAVKEFDEIVKLKSTKRRLR